MQTSPQEVMQQWGAHLIGGLRLSEPTKMEIESSQQNRHSTSFILAVHNGGDPKRLFVKYGAHFSGDHEWDIESEFAGYQFIESTNLERLGFFTVHPIYYQKDPPLIATEFIAGKTLEALYRKSLMRWSSATDFEGIHQLTGKTAELLKHYLQEVSKQGRPLSSQVWMDFCLERYDEIQKWSEGLQYHFFSVDIIERGLERLREALPEDAWVEVRAHGDFGPHNVMVTPDQRCGIIDIGFQWSPNHALPYEDAATFLIYLDEMFANPLYYKRRLALLRKEFLVKLLPRRQEELRLWLAALIKKNLAHLAWFFHPDRKAGAWYRERAYARWVRQKLEWLQKTLISLEQGTQDWQSLARA